MAAHHRQNSDNKRKKKQRNSKRNEAIAHTTSEMPSLTSLSRQETIAHYHTLQKQLSSVDRNPVFPTEAARSAQRSLLRARLRMIGGMPEYQAASRAGEQAGGGFDTSCWVLHALTTRDDVVLLHGVRKRLRMLDVGAIVPRFDTTCLNTHGERIELVVTSIDLHPSAEEEGERRNAKAKRDDEVVDESRRAAVLQADLVQYGEEMWAMHGACMEVVSLGLCLNFEGCARRRGMMLYRAAQLLTRGGLVFLVLPIACVQNSRYCDEAVMQGVLQAVGLQCVSTEDSPSLLKRVLRRTAEAVTGDEARASWEPFRKKRVVRAGDTRNNFAICLDADLLVTGHRGKGATDGTADDVQQGAVDGDVTPRSSDDNVPDRQAGRKRKSKRKKKSVQGIEKKATTSNQRKRARRHAKHSKMGNGRGLRGGPGAPLT